MPETMTPSCIPSARQWCHQAASMPCRSCPATLATALIMWAWSADFFACRDVRQVPKRWVPNFVVARASASPHMGAACCRRRFIPFGAPVWSPDASSPQPPGQCCAQSLARQMQSSATLATISALIASLPCDLPPVLLASRLAPVVHQSVCVYQPTSCFHSVDTEVKRLPNNAVSLEGSPVQSQRLQHREAGLVCRAL